MRNQPHRDNGKVAAGITLQLAPYPLRIRTRPLHSPNFCEFGSNMKSHSGPQELYVRHLDTRFQSGHLVTKATGNNSNGRTPKTVNTAGGQYRAD